MKFLIFFVIFVFSLNNIFARAWDDFDDYSYSSDDYYDYDYSGSSNCSDGCLYFLVIFFVYGIFSSYNDFVDKYFKNKNQKFKNKLNKQQFDYWNDERIKNYISEIFVKVQHSWQNRDISLIEKFLTKNYFSKFSSQLSKMIKNNEKNIVDNINILQIKIISGSIKNGNFSAEISWTLVDYIIINDNPDSSSNFEPEKFIDIWNFVFEENIWKVNSIKKVS